MADYDNAQSRLLAGFDSAFDDIRAFADSLEVLIDGARAGYLTELGKIALITKHCTDETFCLKQRERLHFFKLRKKLEIII